MHRYCIFVSDVPDEAWKHQPLNGVGHISKVDEQPDSKMRKDGRLTCLTDLLDKDPG